MKKVLSLLLILAMLIGVMPMQVFAAEGTQETKAVDAAGTCGENVTWKLDEDGVLTISGTGPMYDYDADEEDDGVFELAPWFEFYEDIKKVIIGEGVTTIGNFSFIISSALTEVIIPDSMTIIGDYAFMGCTSLVKVNIPDNVISINVGAFMDCCALTEITIPDSVTTIGYGAFLNCSALSRVNIPDGLTIIEGETFSDCSSLTEVTIPSSVKVIGEEAFRGCNNLTAVTFVGDAPAIAEDAFRDTTTTCYYPANNDTWTLAVRQDYEGTITWAGYGEISGTCGENVTWKLDEDGLLTISGTGPMYFFDIENVGTPWFEYMEDITKVIIGDGVTSIGAYSFVLCSNLAEVTIPDSVTIIDVGAFMECTSLAEIKIPDSVTTIGYGAFCGCTSLTEITIPDGLTIIEGETFSDCTSLTEVTIPASVKKIAEDVFNDCTNLAAVTFEGDAPEIDKDAFWHAVATCYYPAGNNTWTEDKMQNYEGSITWIAYGNPGPVITQQPVPASATIGENATVFVEADGEGLAYQWYYRDSSGGVFTKSTITKSTYTLTVKKTNVNRELYCIITDANGKQVTTDTVRLIQPLAEELKIITQPASTYALIGEKATVTMEVQGIGLSYQWYYRDLPNGSLTKSSITTADYSLTVKPSYVNREIYCVITDAHGNKVTTDTVRLLQPLRKSLEIIKQPVSSYAAIGETATVSVEANGEGLTYQWYFRNTPNGALSKSSICSNSYSVTVTKANAQRVVYCVITDGHGNKVTTETVALRTDAPAEEPKIYFSSLSDALTGTDGSSTPAGAVARVDKDSRETVITLLNNTVLTESLTVAEDVVIDLNGFAVSSDIFPMIHVKNGTCSLLNGSILLTSDGSGTTSAPAVAITVDSDAGLQASKATVVVTDAANSTVIGISTAADSSLILTETDVTVTTGKSLNNAGIHAKGTAVLTDCSVIAESDYTGANGAYTSNCKGIISEDDLELYDCYVWGAHSGVNTMGNLYVNGGTYEGYGHGAFYISGEGSTNYIYNATIRWATMRAGTVADSVAGTNHSAMYIGHASNITTYFDGCTFSANRSSKKSYCIVLRNSSGESNNCAYVSNSSFKNYNKYAYRSNDVPAERRLFAYSGVGNTYATNKVFQYERNGFYTNESYDQWRK